MQDVAEANTTIRELHSALSQTRYKLVRISFCEQQCPLQGQYRCVPLGPAHGCSLLYFGPISAHKHNTEAHRSRVVTSMPVTPPRSGFQDVVEREQAARVHDVIKSLESLRSKLKQQEETKKAADARASQLAVLVQELRTQSAALQDTLQQRDGQAAQLQRDNSALSEQLACSKAGVKVAEDR